MGTAQQRLGGNLERDVKKLLERNGYYAVKSGGSRGVADVVGVKRGEVLLVQCKAGANGGYMTPSDRERLWLECHRIGAVPLAGRWVKNGREARQVSLSQIVEQVPGSFAYVPWSPDWALPGAGVTTAGELQAGRPA